EYHDVVIKATKSMNDNWMMWLNQKDINANLHFKPNEKKLSGKIEHLYLSKSIFSGNEANSFMAALKPIDIPNLDLIIQNYKLDKVHGDLYITFKNGRITHLSPEAEEKLGLGKLLSILSLQTIPRRIMLDFSDLANDGYSFDVFKGGFTLKNGVLSTNYS